MNIRNIAIIAHVDHGKTSLVNELLKQGNVFRENQKVDDRVMDNNALERERGITILAKNASFEYKDVKINVIDTPGHADFGGEVERALCMADGVLLLVDSFEGPMPQTRFVLEKAIALGHKIIIVINKIDRPDARIKEVSDEILELLLDLNATNEQLNSPIIYASARLGISSESPTVRGTNLVPLFEKIISYIDEPKTIKGTFKMLVSNTQHSDYLGKMAVGKITSGTLKSGEQIVIVDYNNTKLKTTAKVTGLFEFSGLSQKAVEVVHAGDVAMVALTAPIQIGSTICSPADATPIEFTKISEPSVEMAFMVNDSPFAGKEGKFVTSRNLRERLYREAERDISLRVTDGETTEKFMVAGRGEMHLGILIENMRREGYEFAVSQPKVLYKTIDGHKCEPIDKFVVDVPESAVGAVMEKMGLRKGELLQMTTIGSRNRLEFLIPSRGLFGYKSEFLTDTRGEGVMSSVFHSYEKYKGEISRRFTGSLIAHEAGDSNAYGLYHSEDRGTLFIGAGVPVYEGMVVGENPNGNDLVINVCKRKQLTNMRSSSSDEALRLTPPKIMSLENILEFLADDELMEVTPKNVRIRKKILDKDLRMKANK
ncbi:MAG: translational GTPase TypA [Christensenellaceae bacterium]|jgi:GTP-binding protein|nr:translational GTPase TypA [Christensenellaceae bacterium]